MSILLCVIKASDGEKMCKVPQLVGSLSIESSCICGLKFCKI